jgi:hypothetical protein
MTYGNINGLHSKLGSQSHPYGLSLIFYLSIATGLNARFLMLTT